jgi:hypothetical protein
VFTSNSLGASNFFTSGCSSSTPCSCCCSTCRQQLSLHLPLSPRGTGFSEKSEAKPLPLNNRILSAGANRRDYHTTYTAGSAPSTCFQANALYRKLILSDYMAKDGKRSRVSSASARLSNSPQVASLPFARTSTSTRLSLLIPHCFCLPLSLRVPHLPCGHGPLRGSGAQSLRACFPA